MKWARLNFGSFMFPRPPPGTITNEQWTGYQGGGRAAEACSGAEGRPDKPPRLHGAPVSRSEPRSSGRRLRASRGGIGALPRAMCCRRSGPEDCGFAEQASGQSHVQDSVLCPGKDFPPVSMFPRGKHLQRMAGYSPDSASYRKHSTLSLRASAGLSHQE